MIDNWYVPKYCRDIAIKYHIINPGERPTKDYPGCDPEIEILGIEVNGKPISIYLETHLLETHDFEKEIISKIKEGLNEREL